MNAQQSKGCPVIVWDGPYSFRCGAGASVGRCAHHGPFDPSLIRVTPPGSPAPNTYPATPGGAAPDLVARIADLERAVKEAERRGAVRALREAAEVFGPAQITGLFTGQTHYTQVWLRDRADRIEAES